MDSALRLKSAGSQIRIEEAEVKIIRGKNQIPTNVIPITFTPRKMNPLTVSLLKAITSILRWLPTQKEIIHVICRWRKWICYRRRIRGYLTILPTHHGSQLLTITRVGCLLHWYAQERRESAEPQPETLIPAKESNLGEEEHLLLILANKTNIVLNR